MTEPKTAKDALAECREAFERWFSDDYQSMKAIEKNADGNYILQSAYNNWKAWEAAWEARAQPEQAPHGCSCHPDDNPPVRCAKKHAFSECSKTPASDIPGLRERFEKWYGSKPHFEDNIYYDKIVQARWEAWQEAARRLSGVTKSGERS